MVQKERAAAMLFISMSSVVSAQVFGSSSLPMQILLATARWRERKSEGGRDEERGFDSLKRFYFTYDVQQITTVHFSATMTGKQQTALCTLRMFSTC